MNKKVVTPNYEVHIGDVLPALDEFIQTHYANSKKIIIADSNTIEHCLPIIDMQGVNALAEAEVIEIEPGEDHKTMDSLMGVWETFADLGLDRKSLVVNLGGGLIGDLGGYAAGCYLRGIDFIQVPTSLLAMVDASVGGKVGVNLNGAKNQLGLFVEPKAVFAHTPFLESLPQEQLMSGYAEVLKHACLGRDKDLLIQWELPNHDEWPQIIADSVAFKSDVVTQDFKETGLRKQLNWGHTIGHAIESWSHTAEKSLTHGAAVAWGMWVEAFLSQEACHLPMGQADIIQNAVEHFYPKPLVTEADIPNIMNWLQFDKKNENDQIQFALLKYLGDCEVNIPIHDELISQALFHWVQSV